MRLSGLAAIRPSVRISMADGSGQQRRAPASL